MIRETKTTDLRIPVEDLDLKLPGRCLEVIKTSKAKIMGRLRGSGELAEITEVVFRWEDHRELTDEPDPLQSGGT